MSKAVFLMTVLLCGAAQALEPSRFDDANIRASIQSLSSDAFGGRAPASAGEKLTTDYIASQFKRYGRRPAAKRIRGQALDGGADKIGRAHV